MSKKQSNSPPKRYRYASTPTTQTPSLVERLLEPSTDAWIPIRYEGDCPSLKQLCDSLDNPSSDKVTIIKTSSMGPTLPQ